VSRAETITHVAFADESHWNRGRYHALALVTLPVQHLLDFNRKLNRIIEECGAVEFKCKRLDGARERFAALKLCQFATDAGCEGQLRVHALSWDVEDPRHKVIGRDDIANLGRMCYRLFRYVLRVCCPDRNVWRLHPDEHAAIDWQGLQHFVEVASLDTALQGEILEVGNLRLVSKLEYRLQQIEPARSADNPLIQVAGLFAGLATFSRDHYKRFEAWCGDKSSQGRLWQDEPVKTSVSDRERFALLKDFNDLCRQRKLGVSLAAHKGSRTPNLESPVNFWLYEPQDEADKAPVSTRGRQSE